MISPRLSRRHFSAHLAGATLGLYGSYTGTSLAQGQGDPASSAAAAELGNACIKAINGVKADELVILADAFDVELEESKATKLLDALRLRLNATGMQARVTSLLSRPPQIFSNAAADPGPWLMALLGAGAGMSISGSAQSAPVRASLGATLLNAAADPLGVRLAGRAPITGFVGWSGQVRAHSAAPGTALRPLWRHFLAASNVPIFGEVRMPSAAVVVPPRRDGDLAPFTVRRMRSREIGQMMQWEYVGMDPFETRAGTFIFAALYVAVQLGDGTVQMRTHPVGGDSFKTPIGLAHQARVFTGLCGIEAAKVVAAGCIFVDVNQQIVGVTADLADIFCENALKDTRALSVAGGLLKALGYSLDRVSTDPLTRLLA